MLGAWLPLLQQDDLSIPPAPPAFALIISRAGAGGGVSLFMTITPSVGEAPVWPNSLIILSATITDQNGNAYAPSSLALDVKFGGVTTTYAAGSISNPATGSYACNVLAAAAGTYVYRWKSLAAGQQSSVEGTFYVKPSSFQ